MYLNLKLEIWRSGLRQNRLARELKIDEAVLSKVINGFRKPSPRLRKLLTHYFQREEKWLFREEHWVPRRNGIPASKRSNSNR